MTKTISAFLIPALIGSWWRKQYLLCCYQFLARLDHFKIFEDVTSTPPPNPSVVIGNSYVVMSISNLVSILIFSSIGIFWNVIAPPLAMGLTIVPDSTTDIWFPLFIQFTMWNAVKFNLNPTYNLTCLCNHHQVIRLLSHQLLQDWLDWRTPKLLCRKMVCRISRRL